MKVTVTLLCCDHFVSTLIGDLLRSSFTMHTAGQCRNKVDNVRDITRDYRNDVQRKLEDICDLVEDIYDILYDYILTANSSPSKEVNGGDVENGETNSGSDADGE